MSDTVAKEPKEPKEPEVTRDPTHELGERPPFSPKAALQALGEGELGSLRVLLVLALIWAIFQSQNSNFLTAENLTNLFLQITAVGLISTGMVLILLLGEIDLSVGSVSGLAAAVTAVLNVDHGWGAIAAIIAGLAVGFGIGLLNGFFVNFFQIPSFVVTLAGLIAWQGALLAVLGSTGTVNLPSSTITDLTTTFFDDATGWLIGIVTVVLIVGSSFLARRKRAAADLPVEDIVVFVGRNVLIAAAVLIPVLIMNQDRGLPLAVVILVGFVGAFAFITTRTRFGRQIYAVGGSAEAARRSGIKVQRVRAAVFCIGSTMAAAGGIMAASRLLAVNQSSGGSDLLLLSIAGPVVAGVSLFGGRGSVWAALTGALVIGSISNGMDLLALPSSTKFMITGGVLLAAVVLDSVTRHRRQATGRT